MSKGLSKRTSFDTGARRYRVSVSVETTRDADNHREAGDRAEQKESRGDPAECSHIARLPQKAAGGKDPYRG
jgi:hypothetical protein